MNLVRPSWAANGQRDLWAMPIYLSAVIPDGTVYYMDRKIVIGTRITDRERTLRDARNEVWAAMATDLAHIYAWCGLKPRHESSHEEIMAALRKAGR